jgi:hypothetical protein
MMDKIVNAQNNIGVEEKDLKTSVNRALAKKSNNIFSRCV